MTVEVMLMDNVKYLGKAGAMVKVAPGYARNFLIPQGLAAIATDAAKRRLKKLEIQRAEKEAALKKEALEVASKLKDIELNINVPVNEAGKMFGSVTVGQLVEAIESARGVKLESNQIELDAPLRELGEFKPSIVLGHGVSVKFKIFIRNQAEAAV